MQKSTSNSAFSYGESASLTPKIKLKTDIAKPSKIVTHSYNTVYIREEFWSLFVHNWCQFPSDLDAILDSTIKALIHRIIFQTLFTVYTHVVHSTIICFKKYFGLRPIAIFVLCRTINATGLPWPIADLFAPIEMQSCMWISYDHQKTVLFDSSTQKALVEFRAISFMREMSCGVCLWEWAFCRDAILVKYFFLNR